MRRIDSLRLVSRVAALEATPPGQGVSAHDQLSGNGAGGCHPIGAITNLQSSLDAKAANDHHHDADYAAIGHNHDGAYAAAGHTHAGVYEPANANLQAHVAAAHAPANAQKNSDITKAEIEAKLTGEIASHTHAAAPGQDAWTYARLANDFSTTSNAAQDVTGLGFTPAANARYEFEAQLMLRTATATVNPRAGLAWPSGLTDGVANIDEAQSATAILMARGNMNAALLVAVGGLPNTTQSWPCTVWGMAIAGANPAGNVRVQLASETNGTSVTVKAGSFIRWRQVP